MGCAQSTSSFQPTQPKYEKIANHPQDQTNNKIHKIQNNQIILSGKENKIKNENITPKSIKNQKVNSIQVKPNTISIQKLQNVVKEFVKNLINDENVQKFLQILKNQINTNKVYDYFLSKDIIFEILQQFNQRYLNPTQASQLVSIIFNYMALCKNMINKNKKLETNLSDDRYVLDLTQQYQKLKNQILFNNKDPLKIMQYICRSSSKSQQKKSCFLDLKFDLSIQQLRKVATQVKQKLAYELRAFFYLTNYLYKSCLNLEKQKVSISEIQKRLVESLTLLAEQNPPAPPLEGKDQIFNFHKSISFPKDEHEKVVLKFSSKERNKRMDELNKLIEDRVKQSNTYFMKFNEFIKQKCQSQGGFHFRSGVKAKNINNKRAIQRIKQKMLDKNFNKYKLSQFLMGKKQDVTIQEFNTRQQNRYDEQIIDMFERLNDTLQFTVSDLLRAKCLYPSVQKINQTCNLIKQQANKSGLKILQIDNRLKGKTNTSDLVLKILIDKTVTELQLTVNLNIVSYQFSHKIYQLIRSKFFSPLTMLKRYNQQITQQILQEYQVIILKNVKVGHNDYGEKVTYSDCKNYFQQFLDLIPYKYTSNLNYSLLSSESLQQYAARFQKIKQCETKPPDTVDIRKYALGVTFMSNMKQYTKALEMAKKFQQFFKQNYPKLVQKIQKHIMCQGNDEFFNMGTYANFIRSYSICLKQTHQPELSVQQLQKYGEINKYCLGFKNRQVYNNMDLANAAWKAGNLKKADQLIRKAYSLALEIKASEPILFGDVAKNLALIIMETYKYKQALPYLQQSLKSYQTVSKQSSSIALTLDQMAKVKHQLGDFQQALKYAQTSLDMKQKIDGKSSVGYATTLQRLGDILRSDGKSDDALRLFERARQIKYAVYGQNSNYTAVIEQKIADVHELAGRYQKAKQMYYKCMNIKAKLFGEESIQASISYNNIGLIHKRLKQFAKSHQYFQKCLAIQRKIKGQEHIQTASTLSNIAALYKDQEKYEQCLAAYFKSLQIKQKNVGRQNMPVAVNYSNIGFAYKVQKKYPQAQKYYSIAVEIMQKLKGLQSFQLIPTYNNIAGLYSQQQRFRQAAVWKQKVRHLRLIKLGRQNIEYIRSTEDAAAYYKKSNLFSKAIQYYEQALSFRQKKNFHKQAIYCQCKSNYAFCLYNQKKIEQAIKIATQCIANFDEIKVKDRLYYQCFDTLGKIYEQRQQYAKSIQYYKTVIDNYKAQWKFDTKSKFLQKMGLCYEKIGEKKLSEEFYEKSKTQKS